MRVVRQILDRIEKDPEYRHFVLDGQAIILEDYLEIHPEENERIRRLVAAGALSVGPWYILPDEFLVSGEATVRNLLIGHQVAGALGEVQKVGYLPDTFGHLAQMPQILRQAGISSFIYTRGNGDELDELGLEYLWRAPDGSEVLALNQWGGYCNAGGLGYQELWHAHTRRRVDPRLAVERVRKLLAEMSDRANGDIYLLNNGCDHFPPQAKFAAILAELREAFPDLEFKHTGFAEYVAAVEAAGSAQRTYRGELLAGKYHHVLTGVWSARMYLKQLNDHAQTLLSQYLEPLAAYCHFALGQDYSGELVRQAWKLLLRNHPHDSICGCSTDEVHRAMETRFAEVVQGAEQVLRNQLEQLAPTFARQATDDRETVICVVNPLPVTRTEVITRLIVLPAADLAPERLRLYDATGAEVPSRIIRHCCGERFWGIDHRTELWTDRQLARFAEYEREFAERYTVPEPHGDEHDCFLILTFLAENLPPCGHATYYLREGSGAVSAPAAPDGVTVTVNSLDNEYYTILLHPDGRFDITEKTSGLTHTGLNLLIDEEDVGDEYDHAACASGEMFTSASMEGTLRVVRDEGLHGQLETEFTWPLPAAITRDRSARSDSREDCRVRVRVSLTWGSPVVDVELDFENNVCDHRLRALFPTGLCTDRIISDGQFQINSRPLRQPAGSGWVQPPAGTWPQQDFSLVQDGKRGLAVLNRGLPEIATSGDESNQIVLALTLLRCVGWLSRDDFDSRRRTNAGPTVPTPDAQCPGWQHFQYAVVPFADDYLAADIKGISVRWRTPVLGLQGVADQHVPGGQGLLRKHGKATCISAIKRHESRDTLLIRLYNLTAAAVTETLSFGPCVQAAWRTDLLEERQADIAVGEDNSVTLDLRPHEIVTVEVQFGARSASA